MLGLKTGNGIGFNKNGCYTIPAKCFYCNPAPCSLDRVFIITSIGDKNVEMERFKIR
jgi:hypothetical protein